MNYTAFYKSSRTWILSGILLAAVSCMKKTVIRINLLDVNPADYDGKN